MSLCTQPIVFSVVFFWSGAVTAGKLFLSYSAAPFLVIWLERTGFLGTFFVLSVSIGVSRSPTSPATSLGDVRLKENAGNSLLCHLLGAKVPSLSVFSPSFRFFSCLFYV